MPAQFRMPVQQMMPRPLEQDVIMMQVFLFLFLCVPFSVYELNYVNVRRSCRLSYQLLIKWLWMTLHSCSKMIITLSPGHCIQNFKH